ncbi:MAG: pilus assembly protein [Anaerolineae bacterium]|nr:pilus assembly protein [Anaerolineae bacterium]
MARTLLRILDGAPGSAGINQRGQSLLELAFITPLLIIMFIGVVEIGWYANRLLILMEVSRVGARSGTVLTGELSPLQWDEGATLHPIAYTFDNGYSVSASSAYRASLGQSTTGWTWAGLDGAGFGRLAPLPPITATTNINNLPRFVRNCTDGRNGVPTRFYDFIACNMLNSLTPLELQGRDAPTEDFIPKNIAAPRSSGYISVPYPDDIVVSVFALQMINNDNPARYLDNLTTPLVDETNEVVYPRTYNFRTNAATGDDDYPGGYHVYVVGRYPTTANECNLVWQPTLAPNDNDNLDNVVSGPAWNTNDQTLNVGQTFMERLLLPLGYNTIDTVNPLRRPDNSIIMDVDGVTPLSRRVEKASPPIPGGTFTLDTTVRDPFDYIPNRVRDFATDDNTRGIELAGMDIGQNGQELPEFQRGFVWRGQHIVTEIVDPATGRQRFCLGSEWTDEEIEAVMNLPQFLQRQGTPQEVVPPPNGNYNDPAWQNCCKANYDEWQQRASYLPSQGMVLVEMFWSHTLLMDFPFMRPLVTMFGDPQRITISVWAAFPVPTIEPNIVFGLPPN